jgi:DNA polymerase III delta prime subunit
MSNTKRTYLWVERYRPKNVADCILPPRIKKAFLQYVSDGDFPNLLLRGKPGAGKTSLAVSLCNDVGFDFMKLNGSDEGRKIDVLRDKLGPYISTRSFNGKPKCAIIDEADYMNKDSVQPALRYMIEENNTTSRFIMTCNEPNKIIDPLISRMTVIDFNLSQDEKVYMAKEFLKLSEKILKENNVSYDRATVASLIMHHLPDWRSLIGGLQSFAATGEVTNQTVRMNDTFDELISHLKKKDFKGVHQWVTTNVDSDMDVLCRKIFDTMYEKVRSNSIPPLVLILAEYQYKHHFCADGQINMLAMLTQMMVEVYFI